VVPHPGGIGTSFAVCNGRAIAFALRQSALSYLTAEPAHWNPRFLFLPNFDKRGHDMAAMANKLIFWMRFYHLGGLDNYSATESV